MMRIWRLMAALCLLAVSATAQPPHTDAKSSKDHPLFARVTGYYIESYDAQDSFVVEFNTHPRSRVEGRFWKILYSASDSASRMDPVAIANIYSEMVTKRGGTLLLDDVDESGGTTVAEMTVDGKKVWLELSVSNAGEVYDLTIVEEAAAKPRSLG